MKKSKSIHTLKHFLVLFGFVITVLFFYQPNSLFYQNLEVGKVNTKDIIAPHTVTFIDEEATETQKTNALKEVENVYDKDPRVFEKISNKIELFVSSIEKYQAEQLNDDIEKENKMKIDEIHNEFNLSKDTIKKITEVDPSVLNQFKNYITNELQLIYNSGVTEEQLNGTKEILMSDSNLFLFPRVLREEFYGQVVSQLEPNFTLNVIETEKRKKEVLEELEPVYKQVFKGDVVVRKYKTIDEKDMEVLRQLGLVKDGFDFKEFFQPLPLLILIAVLFHLFCNKTLKEDMYNLRNYIIVLCGYALTILIYQFVQNTQWYLIPILTFLIVLTVFYKSSFIIFSSIVLGILINSGDIVFLLLTMMSGLTLIIFKHKFRNFTDAINYGLITGIIVAVFSFIFYITFEHRLVFNNILPLILSGVFSGIIANGLVPLVEKIMGKATVYKLTELNNYEHPLMEELYEKAKGTYDHSRNVAHLATVAAQKIKANSLLVRVAALYHDVGKMDNPEYFIENSTPEGNIHNTINPIESAKVIIEHPIKSAKYLEKYNFPQEVIDIVLKHHGDSVLNHFYKKALDSGMKVTKEEFQYKTDPPETKEETILLIADTVEAYSRTLEYNSFEEVKEKITSLINSRIEEGILRKSELTLKEIEIVLDEMCKALLASHHKRVKY